MMAENQKVGELLYGKDVAYGGLTKLPTEYSLQVSESRDLDCRMTPPIPYRCLECTEILDNSLN